MGRTKHDRHVSFKYSPTLWRIWYEQTWEFRLSLHDYGRFKGATAYGLFYIWLQLWIADQEGELEYEDYEGEDCYGLSKYGKVKYREVMYSKKKKLPISA